VYEPGFNNLGNFNIPMPEGQTLSPPTLGVIHCEYVDEPYIA